MNINTPLISVIMSAFNAEKYLKEAIDSILNQSFADFELIIVNDGSEDTTETIILSYNDMRIKYLKNTENKGLVYSLNRAIDHGKGYYYARMDADDICEIERFSRQINYLNNHPEVGVLGTYAQIIDEKGGFLGKFETPIEDYQIRQKLFLDSPFIHPTVMFRRDILTDQRYDVKFYRLEDYELWVRLAKKTQFHNLPESLLRYRIVPTSETRLMNKIAYEKSRKLMEIYRQLFIQKSITFTEEELLNYSLFMNKANFNHINIPILFEFLKKNKWFENKQIFKRVGYCCIVRKQFKMLFKLIWGLKLL